MDNPFFAGWTFNKTEIRTPEGGFAVGFSTDNAGRAEGWHPKISPDVDPVFYVLDEAKTIPDSIFTAVSRCTLFHAFITSSPGADSGTFYDCFHQNSSLYYKIRVKYEDCPHIEINDPGKAERLKKNTASSPPSTVPPSSANSPTLTDNPSFPAALSWSWSTTRLPSWTPERPAAASTLPQGVMKTSLRPGRATVFYRRPLGRPGHRRSARTVPPKGRRTRHPRRPHLCRRRRPGAPHH